MVVENDQNASKYLVANIGLLRYRHATNLDPVAIRQQETQNAWRRQILQACEKVAVANAY